MEGHIREVEGTIRITRIEVRYQIRIPAGKRAEAERGGPRSARSTLTPCVEIGWEADIREEG